MTLRCSRAMKYRCPTILATLVVGIIFLPPTLLAHSAGLSTSDVKVTTNGLDIEIILAVSDLTAALGHLDSLSPWDLNGDGHLSQKEFDTNFQRFKTACKEVLTVEF